MKECKYKQTEIGLIPEDWELTKLGNLGYFSKGSGISREESHSGNIAAIRYGEIYTSHNDYIKEFYSGISKEISLTSKKLKYGDLLFAASGETKEEIGKCVAFLSHEEAYAGGDIIILSIDTELHDSRFWGYCLNSLPIVKQKSAKGQGDAVVHIVPRELGNIDVAVPLRREQERIAEALSNIDKLISSLSKMIEKKRLIKQGAMQQLLTGKKRLLGFDGEWEKHKIGDFLSILKGYGLSKSHLVQDGKNKCILYGELFTRYDYEIKTCISKTGSDEGLLSECGDILMPSSTTTNGIDLAKAVSVYESNIHLGGDIVVLRDKNIFGYEPYFVSAQITELCKHAIEQSSQGITIIHLNTRELRNVEIALPLARKEQMAIANVLRTMDSEIESLEEERDKYIRLKEGMMQKLLTGQIRLIEAETKLIAQPKAKVANVYFKRSVLAAEIADRLCEEKTFGHVKMEKLIFLTEHLCHIDIDSHYHRDAAGPYDNTALRSIDSQMRKQHWFELTKKDKGYRYQPMDRRGEHKKYFDRYFADILPMFNKVVETFKTSTTEQCEIVATLYSAWDDLLQSRQSFTDDDILNEVLNNWHESKKHISRNRWQAALNWMRSYGFVPQKENN